MPSNPPKQVNAFTIKYSGRANRILTDVSVTPAFDPREHPQPPYPLYKTTALWDTGATSSVITAKTAKENSLTPVGITKVNHAGGSSEANTYLVNFFLPNRVAVPGVLVSECPDNDGAFGAIIGMDIISRGDIAITNLEGKTWMSFRIPSMQAIDYVVETNQLIYSGTGRNAPCPCGKKNGFGKPIKFKNCHGKGTGN